MIKNKFIKKLLLEGSTQISAVLPRQNITDVENNFSLYFPLLLNNEVYDINNEIEKFQIVFYNQQSFSEDFNRKFNSETEDFKTFSESSNTNYFSGMQKKINNSFYFDKNVTSRSYNIDFSTSNIELINNQKIYRLAFTNSQSKQIKNGKFNCCRIFCLKNKSIIDDTDIVTFSSSNFINDVFETRIIYDLNYFLDNFYFNNFSNNLELVVNRQLSGSRLQSAEEINRFIVAINQEIDPNVGSGTIDFVVEYIDNLDTFSITKSIDLSNLSRSNVIEDTTNIFEKICEDIISGKRSFIFNITCMINFSNSSINKIFTKNIRLGSSNPLIRNIFELCNRRVFSSLLKNLNFEVIQNIENEFFKINMSSRGTEFSPDILSNFAIKEIKINNTSIANNLFLTESMDINSSVDLIGKSLLEAFDIQKKSIEIYTKNTNALRIKTTISIKSIFDESFVKNYESSIVFNKVDYKSLYNDANEIFKRIIEIVENEPALENINDSTPIQSYSNISLTDLKKFKNLAYQLGFYEENLNQNSEVIANIVDFLSSCVFMIDVSESFSTYKTDFFKIKSYYYGEEILDLENFDIASNVIFFKQEFIDKINNSFGLVTKNVNENNKIFKTIKRVITKNIESRFLKAKDVKKFLNQKTLQSSKEIKIALIPIPKIIKVFQGTGIDKTGNLIFKDEVTSSTRSETSLRFVNMFYDSNSSLNWDFYNKIKNTFFFNKDNSDSSLQFLIERSQLKEAKLALANTVSPIWDYLSSSLYIDEKNIFFKSKTIKKEEFFSKFKKADVENNDIHADFHFESFSKKYFNFRENSKEIFLDRSNLLVKYLNYESGNPSYPKKISFEKSGIDRNINFVFDVTYLKNKSETDSIVNSEVYLKYSIHPLIEKTSNENFTFNTPYYVTSTEAGKKFVTQNHVYMSKRRNDFISYNTPLNKNSMEFVNTENKLFLNVYVDQDLNKITTQTFKDLFNFCLQNECNSLHGFYLRLGLSFKIQKEYFYTNIVAQIPRKNLNNDIIFIDRISTIVS
tara:strand:+ start:4308 stop:7379 length:3072 start_codon:yes stop_codon:yes gene_type:complete